MTGSRGSTRERPAAVTTTPTALLDAWRPDEDVLWSSPRGTLLAAGTAERLDLPWTTDLPGAVAERLREARGRGEVDVVVGALPFATGVPAALVRPEALHRAAGRLVVPPATADEPALARVVEERPVPAEEDYRAAVRRALRLLADDRLEKVVLARAVDLRTDGPVDVRALLRALARLDERARVFAVPLPDEPGEPPAGGPGRTLVGASPELLCALHGDTVTAVPLAGTAARQADPADDAAAAAALLASDKDRREHAIVVEAMVAALGPWCADLQVPTGPQLVATPTAWHLATRLEGRRADAATTSLHLARALHPTPAVGGMPAAAACLAVEELEPVDRGFYAGAVGWADASGDGEWAVSIRCGVAGGDTVRLHAGAGVVRGSDPEAELAETGVKLDLLRRALGA